MNIIGIIPARLGSSRFPNKPLAPIVGIPMLGHVFFRSRMSKSLSEVYIATCDEAIASYIESVGGKAIMTATTHERASDRTAEALLKVEQATHQRVDIVVMIQGDEPMIVPDMIDQAVMPFTTNPEIEVVNLMSNLKSDAEFEDPNEVKVVIDRDSNALYFSREPIPSRKKGIAKVPMLKQVCIIPFRRDFLLKFNQLEQTPLEIIESVDMNRVLEHGFKVKMVRTEVSTYSVDTKEDLESVEHLMKMDPLVKSYLSLANMPVMS